MQVEVTSISSQREESSVPNSQLTKYCGREVERIPKDRGNLIFATLSLAEKFFISIEHLIGIKRTCFPAEVLQTLRDMDHLSQEAKGKESEEEDAEELKGQYQKQVAQQVEEVAVERKRLWQSAHVATEREYNEKARLLARYCEVAEATYFNTPDHVQRRKTIDEFLLLVYQKTLNPPDFTIISRYWDYVTGKCQGKEAHPHLKKRMRQLFIETITQQVLTIPRVIENTLKANPRIQQGLYIVNYLQSQADRIVENLQKERACTKNLYEQLTFDYLLLMGRPRLHVVGRKILREVLSSQIEKLKESLPELILSIKRSHENEIKHYQNYLRSNQVALEVAKKKKLGCDSTDEGLFYYAQLEINILTGVVQDTEQNIHELRAKTEKDFSAQASEQVRESVEELQSYISPENELEQLMSSLEQLESKEGIDLDDLKISLTDDPVGYFVQKIDRLDQEKLKLFQHQIEVEEID